MSEKVGAQVTDPVWVNSAEVGKDSVASLIVCLVQGIPDPNSEFVDGRAVGYVGDPRLVVPDTLLDNFTSVFGLVVPLGWVPRK